jgi:hypothetical protein
LHNSSTVIRIVKHIPFGSFYPINLSVTLPHIEFLEKTPLWETERWNEMARNSALSQLSERVKISGDQGVVFSPEP